MTKEKKIIVIITIISILVIAILSYFLINKNAIIEKQAEKIELQAMETNGSNSYITTQEHLKEISLSNIDIQNLMFTTTSYSYNDKVYRTLEVQQPLGEEINSQPYGKKYKQFSTSDYYMLYLVVLEKEVNTLNNTKPTIVGGTIHEWVIDTTTNSAMIKFTVDNTTSTRITFSFSSGNFSSYRVPCMVFKI